MSVATTSVSSPFLSVDQAAQELGTTSLNVRRLCARGVLKCAYVGGNAIRITPADVAEYAAAGSPDFNMPTVDPDGSYKIEGPYVPARRLERDIRDALTKIADETTELPPSADIVVSTSGKLAGILTGPPYTSLARVSGQDDTPPFKTRAEGYAIAFLRENVGAVDPLFRTQTEYRAAVDAAWSRWEARSFSVRKTYPSAKPHGQPTTVTFRVPYSALNVDQQRVTQLGM